ILKHTHASEATISLFVNGHNLSLEIQDNGQGCDPLARKEGIGFYNMFTRVEYYQGTIQFIPSDGKGCTLHIEIPV
ncbi:MAG TPA: ATP-binding protein, partial [Chitinophagaceae bacterium]|nr:ATP-binding protein [Chitinophagaceae bacterium]